MEGLGSVPCRVVSLDPSGMGCHKKLTFIVTTCPVGTTHPVDSMLALQGIDPNPSIMSPH